MRIAITGTGGRLGSALVTAFMREAPIAPAVSVEGWVRPTLDLDRPATLAALVRERRPNLVIHAAAWTDVDGCATEPELAMRRNGEATAALAAACTELGADLLYVSTNEVFNGRRTDGRPYAEDDPPSPANAYGQSKRTGEVAVLYGIGAVGSQADLGAVGSAPTHGPARRWVVRTSWLYGPPGADFPARIITAAARAAAQGTILRLVADEFGCPTRAADLASGIVALLRAQPESGIYHLVNAGHTSRADWAEAVLREAEIQVLMERVPGSAWPRPSTPPPWGVMGTSRAAQLGIILRGWRAALFDEVPRLLSLAVEARASAAQGAPLPGDAGVAAGDDEGADPPTPAWDREAAGGADSSGGARAADAGSSASDGASSSGPDSDALVSAADAAHSPATGRAIR